MPFFRLSPTKTSKILSAFAPIEYRFTIISNKNRYLRKKFLSSANSRFSTNATCLGLTFNQMVFYCLPLRQIKRLLTFFILRKAKKNAAARYSFHLITSPAATSFRYIIFNIETRPLRLRRSGDDVIVRRIVRRKRSYIRPITTAFISVNIAQ